MAAITCYGGVGEIGGNKLLLEAADTSIFLDFGYAIGAEARYFEEFLQPRSTSKLHDLLALDLLPAVDGVYRRDALQPRGLDQAGETPARALWDTSIQSYDEAHEAGDWTPDAVFLSHAHLDHAGYIPYLGDLPIYCSPATQTVLDTLADITHLTGFDSELREIEPRVLDEYSGGYFPGTPKITKDDAVPRDYHSITPANRQSLRGLELEVFDVGHSIPGSLAALIESPDRQIVYTGDLRFHGRSGIDLGEELHGLRPDALLCEGTRIDDAEADDEQRVEDEMTAVIADTDGLAMVGFAWKDLERYETVRRRPPGGQNPRV